MYSLKESILMTRVAPGQVAVFWIGQAGFVFKDSMGRLTVVDPYLSDCCERYDGFARIMPHMIDPDDLVFDTILITHEHFDHFDPDSAPLMLANGRTHMVAARDVEKQAQRLGLRPEQMTYVAPGDTLTRPGLDIRVVDSDHGPNTPDAVGFALTFEGKRIYIAGDTCFRQDIFEQEARSGHDLLIIPINGAFGNLNEEEGVRCAAIVRPGLVVPSHFWNFAEQGGDPFLFTKLMKQHAPEIPYQVMKMEGLLYL